MRPLQEEFFDTLYREHFNRLKCYAYRFVKNWDDAEFAVQDAFIVVLRKIDEAMSKPDVIPWIKKIIKNVTSNMNKSQRNRSRLLIPLEELSVELADQSVDKSSLGIFEQHRKVVDTEDFELYRSVTLGEVSCADAAKKLGISIWACYKRVERTEEQLKRAIEEGKLTDE